MERIFSGIQPTGFIHIGNYFGALKDWVELQNTNQFDCFFSIVDLHAQTIPYNIKDFRGGILQVAKILFAIGLSPDKSCVFVQSQVSEHTQLMWYLSTVTLFSELNLMTQFKDKSELHGATAGLFMYPVLMAADILLYGAKKIPVGEDQRQHLELTRSIVRQFAKRYSFDFEEPLPLHLKGVKMLGLDGKAKMSKSLNNYISLLEDEKTLWDKLKKAKTDENRIRREDPGDVKNCPFFTLHQSISKAEEQEEIRRDCSTARIGCIDCKKILFKHLNQLLEPIRNKVESYSDSEIRDFLISGREKASILAKERLTLIQEAMGMFH